MRPKGVKNAINGEDEDLVMVRKECVRENQRVGKGCGDLKGDCEEGRR